MIRTALKKGAETKKVLSITHLLIYEAVITFAFYGHLIQ